MQKVAEGEKLTPPLIPNTSLEDAAGPISRMFMFYLSGLLQKGSNKLLELEDLGTAPTRDRCAYLYKKFEFEWGKEVSKPEKKRSLWNALLRTVGVWRFWLSMFLYTINAAAGFGPILILNALVRHFDDVQRLPVALVWILVALLFFVPVIGSVAYSQSNVILNHIAVQFRNVLVSALYRKALVLGPSAKQTTSTGQIVNMFSTDTKQLVNLMQFLSMIVVAPSQIIVALALIYLQVGYAMFVGLGLMIILTPFNGFVFAKLSSYRREKMKFTDSRVKMMNEILAGIRIIKYYAWEAAFKAKVEGIRKIEMTYLYQMAIITSVAFSLVLLAIPVIQPILIFYTFVKLKHQLDAATAYTTISLFNLIRFPFAFLPMGLVQWSQAKVSLERMSKFLVAEELTQDGVTRVTGTYDPTVGYSEDVAMKFDNVNMSWILPSEADRQLHASAAVSTAVADEHELIDENKRTLESYIAVATTSGEETKNVEGEAEEGLKDVDLDGTGDDTAEKETAVAAVLESTVDAVGGEVVPINRSMHTLQGVSLEVQRGQLVAVVGQVGSGKSSLISGILGELHLLSGAAYLRGSVAYCDQKPWILNATLKDNVLFGQPYDEARFQAAIHAASLEDDVKVLPGGVLTEIGERGINLSGGQKARVALARAVYRDADVYLLDDPLSAVDAHVGQHLFSECILRMLAGKTRVLVTHHVHYLPQCDLVVVLDEGRVKACGSYAELRKSGVDIDSFVPRETEAEQLDRETEEANGERVEDGAPAGGVKEKSGVVTDKPVAAKAAADNRESQIIVKEERQAGSVSGSTYWYYVNAGGLFWYVLLAIATVGAAGLDLASNFWLAYWSAVSLREKDHGDALGSGRNLYYVNYYAMFGMLGVVCIVFRSLFLAYHRLLASLVLHGNIMKSILACPTSFFDVTPIGRILNRFSSDFSVLDEDLAQNLSQLVNGVSQVIESGVAIAIATKGTFVGLAVPLCCLYYWFNKFYRRTSTEIQRLANISLSPIYADFSQSLVGVATIRAYGLTSEFVGTMESNVDKNSCPMVLMQLASQWLGIRLDVIGAFISFFIAALAAGAGTEFVPASFLALALSFSINLTTYLKFVSRIMANTEANMSSVERIHHYGHNLEQEGVVSDALPPPPPEWPQEGRIVGSDVKMRYRDGPLVLKGIDFAVEAGEKVGIAGRTGSGKSSLMVALFRMQELDSGSISIDGLDCSKVPLKILRSKIGMIPQDPVMFSVTVRFNLDPFDE